MNKKTVNKWMLCILIVLFALAILLDAKAVAEGVRTGLSVSAGVLIPSMFPFMSLCGFISLTRLGENLSRPFAFITERLFRLPGECGSAILLSLIGGYPSGARMVSDLLARRRIGKKTAERMLCFCVNAGPPFMMTAVGAGMFMSREAGVILLVSQVAATFAVGIAVSFKAKREDKKPFLKEKPPSAPAGMSASAAFVEAVSSAASAVITLCAFAVFFSGVMEMVRSMGFIGALKSFDLHADAVEAAVCGFFEVTSGCLASAKMGGSLGFAMASACVSFGGVSVIFQVTSFFREQRISMKPYVLSRFAHMAASAGLSALLYGIFCGSKPVFAGGARPEMLVSGRTAIFTLCLIGMSTILLLSSGRKSRG